MKRRMYLTITTLPTNIYELHCAPILKLLVDLIEEELINILDYKVLIKRGDKEFTKPSFPNPIVLFQPYMLVSIFVKAIGTKLGQVDSHSRGHIEHLKQSKESMH